MSYDTYPDFIDKDTCLKYYPYERSSPPGPLSILKQFRTGLLAKFYRKTRALSKVVLSGKTILSLEQGSHAEQRGLCLPDKTVPES